VFITDYIYVFKEDKLVNFAESKEIILFEFIIPLPIYDDNT
jgi:hypothetical protein